MECIVAFEWPFLPLIKGEVGRGLDWNHENPTLSFHHKGEESCIRYRYFENLKCVEAL
jgi:hypothetical protein